MKRYIYIVVAGFLLSFTSCTMTDVDVESNFKPSANGGLQFIGAAEDFDIKDVTTRADEVSDSHISEMTMLIYKANGDMLPAVDASGNPLPSSHININKPNPTFLIEANKYDGTGILASMEAGVVTKYYDNKAEDLTACRIYIVANAYHLIGERLEAGKLNTIAALEAAILETEASLAMPVNADGSHIGLPMIGCAWDDGKYNNDGSRKIKTFNLKYKGEIDESNSVATIPLKKLYSKVRFTMEVNSLQYVKGEQIPQFTLRDVEVFNIPAQVRMEYQEGDYRTNYPRGEYLYSDGFSLKNTSLWPSRTTIMHDSSEKIDFYFFMPEHKVSPYFTKDTYTGYPSNLPSDRKQYYKPKLVSSYSSGGVQTGDRIASFVRIHGDYTNHNGEIYSVSYDIYLGQNEVDNFEIKRNQQLNNNLTITGLTNHKEAYPDVEHNISIDHRVTMTGKGYILSMEREAILDSHFEVRPLDVVLSPGGKMTIVIPDEYKSWIAMESDDAAYTGPNSPYVSDSPRRGVRKYFTTLLVSDLNANNNDNGGNGGKIELTYAGDGEHTDTQRVWFYIDENPNVYDKTLPGKDANGDDISYAGNNTTDSFGVIYNTSKNLYRVGKVNFFFTNDGTDPTTTSTPTSIINFQQWNLWRVWSADKKRYYDIEHEEEYLNNYASDQQYGGTQDGMPWGLDGLQLSDTDKAFYIQSKLGLNFITRWFSSKAEPYKYDFYISAEESNVIDYNDDDKDGNNSEKIYHPYNGLEFTKEIVKEAIDAINPVTSKPYIDKLRTLVGDPESAVEYCYNKNRRNPTNNEITDVKWYLPSVDEIEDITVGAYDEFDKVFQNKLYWASQPAYIQKAWHGTFWVLLGTINYDGYLYIDNKQYARSTKVLFNGTNFVPASSGMSNTNIIVNLGDLAWGDGTATESKNNNVPVYGEGYKARTEKCRIRAVYRSGTK